MNKVYDDNAQLDILINMVRMGEVRLRMLSVPQIVATGAQTYWPLTDDKLTDWFQTGWDHYWFDLPHFSVNGAVATFRRLGKDW